MTDDIILQMLDSQARAIAARSEGEPKFHATATMRDIKSAERKLGFSLPPLLKRIYLEMANGGCTIGPGYGLLGLPGGYDNGDDWNVVKTTIQMAQSFEWWNQSIVVCDWGCCMRSCIDCSNDEYPVYRFDGNFLTDLEEGDDFPEGAWSIESTSFAKWVLTPNVLAKSKRTKR